MSQNKQAVLPVILELAALPREQVGPFLILGVDKVADREEVDAAWAKRLIWARKGLVKTSLEDINWARDVLNESERRFRADAASLNLDTSDGVLRRLHQRYAGKTQGEVGGRPLDAEPALADYAPSIPVPDPDEVRKDITVGEVPRDLPAVAVLLDEFLRAPIDPWAPGLLPDEDAPG